MEIILAVISALILIVVVVNYRATRKLRSEVKGIRKELSLIDNGDDGEEVKSDMHSMISNLHDSLLNEFKKLEESFGEILEDISPNDELSEDLLYDQALKVVTESGRASASLLQRRLRVGYARAARLLDMLEENGVISAGEGAEPRKVLEKE